MTKGWALLAFLACIPIIPSVAQTSDPQRNKALRHFGILQPPPTAPKAEVDLGRALFWDVNISVNGKTSCASCHPATAWGADAAQFSLDALGKLTPRNSPTVFNSMTQPSLRWLGDRKTGAHQAEGSLTGSMGFPSKEAGVERLRQHNYQAAFRAAFPEDDDPLSAPNYGRAIASYLATLVTPAPFDRFLAGDGAALNSAQRAGLEAFINIGCADCHSGPLVGGTEYRRFGITKDYWLATGVTKIDQGRFTIIKQEADRYVFRVPMLRNIAKTAPYFHDGSVAELDRAVRIMGEVQLGTSLDELTIGNIVAFLNSLTGEIPPNYAAPGQRSATMR